MYTYVVRNPRTAGMISDLSINYCKNSNLEIDVMCFANEMHAYTRANTFIACIHSFKHIHR